ncbi:unnamed protein product [Symbiodinium sp. CCMP2592]|nr:unnamed protein product [Symbiodinium sp. CCMP2592]
MVVDISYVLLRAQDRKRRAQAAGDTTSVAEGTSKTAWQASKTKPVNRSLSFADSLVETPPHRINPKASAEDLSGEKPSAPSVLKRAQTVDGTGTSVRKAEALRRQKELEEELEEERLRQAGEAQELKDKEPECATDLDVSLKKTKGKSPKAKAKPKAASKAAAKADSTTRKNHATARSSKDAAPPQSPDRSAKQSPKKTPSPKKPSTETAESPQDPVDPAKAELMKSKKKVAHKLYMRFWRSIQSKTSMSTLYEDFVATGGKWKNGVIMKTIRSKKSSGARACRKWLTRKQMLQYFDNDKDLVEKIIVRKESDPELLKAECRDHPECPGLRQYLVLVEDEEMAAESVEIEDLFQAEDDSASSSDESSESDDSSSSEDSGKKKKSKRNSKKSSKDKKSKKNKKDKRKSKKKAKGKRKGKGKNKGEDDEEKEAARKIGLEAKKVGISSRIDAVAVLHVSYETFSNKPRC